MSEAQDGAALLDEAAFTRMREERIRFLDMVAGVRAELHRYCARMVGSAADGEDVVQDALARAYYELAGLREAPAMRAWLFRIAHNRALDWLRRTEVRMSEPLEDEDMHEAGSGDPEDLLARKQAVGAALSRFMELAPAQRSCVILADVLEHTVEEIAALLDLSVPAVKAALVRGRARLRSLPAPVPASAVAPPAFSPELLHYIDLFNARDWDAVRTLLADDVKLDLVARAKSAGKRQVSVYYTNYDKKPGWHMAPALLDGREVIAAYRGGAEPAYYIELQWQDGKLKAIRDYFFVPYILRDVKLSV